MPARVSSDQLDVLAALVAEYPDGASLEQLRARLTPQPAERTLRRLLAQLVADRRIERVGAARDARYRVRARAHVPSAAGAPPPRVETPAPVNAAMLMAEPTDARSVDDRIFDLLLGNVMIRPSEPEETTMLIQGYVRVMHVPPAERGACIARIEARLQALTLEDAVGYGYKPQQYANWRAMYSGVTGPDPTPAGRAATPLAASATSNVERRIEPADDGDAASAASLGEDFANATVNRGNAEERKHGTTPALRSRSNVAATPAAPSGLSTFNPQLSTASVRVAQPTRAEAFITRAMGTGRQLATPARAAISAGWGAALSLSADAIGAQGPTWLVTAPLAAIPSLVFLARDRLSSNESLDAPSVTAALTAGGGAIAVGKTLAMMAHGAFL